MAGSTNQARQQSESDYRQRFLDALDAHEALERDAGRRVASLASLLARAGRALGVDGEPTLARQLDTLSDRLHQRPLDPVLSRDVSTLKTGLLEFMDARERARDAQIKELERCAGQLDGLLTSWRARGALKRFQKRIKAGRETPASLLSALADLHERLPEAADIDPQQTQDDASVVETPAPAEPVQECTASAALAPAAVHETSAPDFDERAVRDVILALLDDLELPDSAKELTEALREAVASELDESCLTRALDLLGQIAEHALNAVRSDYGVFLDAIDRQLDALLSAMSDARESEQANREQQQRLSGEVHEALDALRDQSMQATDLDQLKRSIASHLEQLTSGLGRLTRQEESALAAREVQFDAMRERVHALEEESAQARKLLEEQRHLAHTDSLTGIANRAGLSRYMETAMAKVAGSGVSLAVVLLDIDHFKQVNDTYGHPAGDHALGLIANIIRSRIRSTDFCARFGGEEFVVALEAVDAKTAERIAEQLRAFVESCGCNYQGQHIALTASFGVTLAVGGDTFDSVVARADCALYEAKRAGRNRVIIALD